MKNISNILTVVMLCGLLSFLSSCSGRSVSSTADTEQDIRPLDAVVVLPAEAGGDGAADGQGNDSDSLRKGAGFIDLTIADITKDCRNVRVLTASQVESLMDEGNKDNSADVIGHLGKTLHCDAVMVTTVHRYRQRVGSDMAIESPASASFQIRLVDVKTRAVLWSADFDETQESLLSNILSFSKAQSRGFKWVTVENLVAQGLKDRLAGCPFLKR
ncbi:hypothetical protein JWG42_15465 [Desulfoprunum benzoelyticum]|uniref:Penicillin-binding protein activator LpoB n=1 Tax=Desulfoprunum benzoelyticum TaxID=1506996 RepID=A0A840V1F3_9BACT|nr:hypothetical protein [Desulfoprunum benzoelyticum]MBB5349494.1 hypothetical protein [Desulfoprunum benzoelyticum]MBM9531557.1 hypothetical protein [Desulfoprunum benzoelyticum]